MTTKTTTPEVRTIVYTGERAITVPVPGTGHNEIYVWGDEFPVDHTFAHFDRIGEEIDGRVLFIPADSPSADEVRQLRLGRDLEARDAAMQSRLQAATTAERRAEIRIRERAEAVAYTRAQMDASTAGSSR